LSVIALLFAGMLFYYFLIIQLEILKSCNLQFNCIMHIWALRDHEQEGFPFKLYR